MLDVEQEIVEAYFESNGFLVRQAGKPDDSENKKKNAAFAHHRGL